MTALTRVLRWLRGPWDVSADIDLSGFGPCPYALPTRYDAVMDSGPEEPGGDLAAMAAPADWGEGYEIEPEPRAVVHHGAVPGCALCADLPDLIDRTTPSALAREGWLYAAAGALAFTVGWIILGLAPAMYATAVGVIVFLAVLLISRAETRRLRDALGRADDELDDYDTLRDLAAAVVDTRPGTREERAALRALRNARPVVLSDLVRAV